jgi:hypothetical protein
MEAYSDRSRLLKHQSCPRARYFEYEIPTSGKVNGVVSTKLDLDLLVGSCFHRGCEALLKGAPPNTAVQIAVDEEFWPVIKSRGAILGEKEDAHYVYHEHAAMIEALIRGWEKFSLPQLLDRFQVVEVEEEYLGKFEVPGFTLHFGARIDALLMEKSTLDLYVLSLKTTKEWGKKSDDEARHDMQGLSETEVVDQKLLGWHNRLVESKARSYHSERIRSTADGSTQGMIEGFDRPVDIPRWFALRFVAGASPQVSGVKMEFALKGRKSEYPEGSGRWSYSNPLIRPWKKADDLGGSVYAFKWQFQDDYGKNHTLGKGWNRINIWEDIGVNAWIDYLASTPIQGFEAGRGIAGQFVLPMEYYRNDEDIVSMKRQVAYEEKRIQSGREHLEDALPHNFEERLDEDFPMHRKSCDWPKRCVYQDICYGPKAYLHDPISSQIYQIRIPNHKIEETLLTERK